MELKDDLNDKILVSIAAGIKLKDLQVLVSSHINLFLPFSFFFQNINKYSLVFMIQALYRASINVYKAL